MTCTNNSADSRVGAGLHYDMKQKCAKCGRYIDTDAKCSCGYDIATEEAFAAASAPEAPPPAEVSAAISQTPFETSSGITEFVYEGEWEQLQNEALNGSTEAMMNLYNSLDSEGHITESLKWLRMAAEHGDALAQFMYGIKCNAGSGVPHDAAEAGKWYRLASAQGYGAASWAMGNMYLYEVGEGDGPDFQTAVNWYLLAGEQGCVDGWHALGCAFMYGEGIGAVQDTEKGLKYLRLAAGENDFGAQFLLGEIYSMGKYVPQDFTVAEMWYALAALNGHNDALLRLMALQGPTNRRKEE